MQRLDALAAARDVRWTWVRGHAGEAGNERADHLATLGRRETLSGKISGGKTSGEATLPPAETVPAPAPPVQAKTVQVALSADLANALSRAAGRAGITPQAYLEDAVRLALELKPPGVARVRAELQKAS